MYVHLMDGDERKLMAAIRKECLARDAETLAQKAYKEQRYVMTALRRRFPATSVTELEDCFQDAVIDTVRNVERVDPSKNIRSWLIQTAVRRAMDRHRARSRRVQEAPISSHVEYYVGKDDESFDLCDTLTDAWALADSAGLTERRARIFRMLLEGKDYEDVAQEMDTTLAGGKTAVWKTRAILRKKAVSMR